MKKRFAALLVSGWITEITIRRRKLFSPLSFLILFLLSSPSLSQAVPCSDLATVAGGMNHTVGLKTDGTVVGAGNTGSGKLNVSTWTNIKAVAAGSNHTVGLKEDGTVVAVGDNYYGQLNVSTWTNIKAIAAGYYHTVGLREDGTVVAAGNNDYGQSDVSTWTNIKAISAGAVYTVGLKEDGTLVAAGNNYYGQLNFSGWTNIKAIATGYHTVGLREDGTVVAVGNNQYGQLNLSGWTNIKAIAAGYMHTVGLKEDGTIAAAGDNRYGQLNVSSWTNIKSIAAGYYYTVGLKEDGTVVAAGDNRYGQLNVPATWADLKAVSASSYRTFGIREDGTVAAVGYNSYYDQYGPMDVSSWTNIKSVSASNYYTVGLKEDGTVVSAQNYLSPLNLSSWTNIKAVTVGYTYPVGLKEDGTVVTVGSDYGLSTWTNIKAIAGGYGSVVGLKEDGTVVAVGFNLSTWTNIKAVAAGSGHAVGLKEDGTVVAAGNNSYGQLNVSAWTNIKAVASGGYHTIGLKEDGTVVAVGLNSYGQLNVSTWTNIKAVTAGFYHTVGLKEDGTLVVAGDNTYGQLNLFSKLTDIMPVCGQRQDGVPPITTAMVSGTVGSNGWYWSDVQVTLTATDENGGSGVKEIHYSVDDGAETVVQGGSASVSVKGDGTHAVTYYAIDNALNEETPHQAVRIMIDKTSPTITATVSPAPNANGWNNTDVTVTFTCSDSGSGIGGCTPPVVVKTEGPGQEVSGYAKDFAGNIVYAKVVLNIDKTIPRIDLWPERQPNQYGWYNKDVDVRMNCFDSLSGIEVCERFVHLLSEGANQRRGGRAMDKAGNKNEATISVNIDLTPPAIKAVVTPAPNANGWHNTDVTVTFACSDALSGIASCPAPVLVSTEGAGQVVKGVAVDKAGNTATTTVTLNIDKTAPTVALSVNPGMLWPPDHKMVNVAINGGASDDASGVESVVFTVTDEYGAVQPVISGFNTTIPLEAWRAGTDMDGRLYTVTAVATDKAGNRSTGTTTVLVPHDMR